MNRRKVYHVMPDNAHDTWRVEFGGAARQTRAEGTREVAIAAAKGLADNDQPSQVIIHGPDGSIEDELNFGELLDEDILSG